MKSHLIIATLALSIEAMWDGTSDRGEVLAAGVYFSRIESDSFAEPRSLVLVR